MRWPTPLSRNDLRTAVNSSHQSVNLKSMHWQWMNAQSKNIKHAGNASQPPYWQHGIIADMHREKCAAASNQMCCNPCGHALRSAFLRAFLYIENATELIISSEGILTQSALILKRQSGLLFTACNFEKKTQHSCCTKGKRMPQKIYDWPLSYNIFTHI